MAPNEAIYGSSKAPRYLPINRKFQVLWSANLPNWPTNKCNSIIGFRALPCVPCSIEADWFSSSPGERHMRYEYFNIIWWIMEAKRCQQSQSVVVCSTRWFSVVNFEFIGQNGTLAPRAYTNDERLSSPGRLIDSKKKAAHFGSFHKSPAVLVILISDRSNLPSSNQSIARNPIVSNYQDSPAASAAAT